MTSGPDLMKLTAKGRHLNNVIGPPIVGFYKGKEVLHCRREADSIDGLGKASA